jgi:hypothetical protein
MGMKTTTAKQLANRVQLFLRPGEQVRQAFLGQRGPSPYAWVIMWLLGPFMPLRIVVVTDQAILLLRASKFPYARPKSLHALLARLPRQQRLGPVGGAWSRITVGSEELWVSRPFHSEVNAADEALDSPVKSEDVSVPLDSRGGGAANVLLPLGLFAAILGGWDASSAQGDQERLLGIIFAFAGFTMLAAGVCLLSRTWRDEWGRPLGIIAGAAGVGVGLYFAVSQLGYPGATLLGIPIGHGRTFWFGVTLMAAAAVAIWRLPRPDSTATTHGGSVGDTHQGQDGGSKRARTVATVLASVGALVTLLFGFLQFWYTNQYLPGKGGTALAVTSNLKELESGDQTGRNRIFAATLKIKNISNTRTQILSSLYTMTGVVVAEADKRDESFFSRAVQESNPLPIPDWRASRYSKEDGYDLLKFGDVVPEGWYFEPAEDYSTQIILSVPRDTASNYQFLRVGIDLSVAKGNRLIPDFGGSRTYPQELVVNAKRDRTRYIVTEQPIKPLSQIDRMTRGAHAYASVVDLRTDEIPFFYVCIDGAERFEEVDDPEAIRDLCASASALGNKLWESYGLSWASALHDFGVARPADLPGPFTG